MNDYLNLVRLPNLIFIAILMYVMEKWVAVPVLDQLQMGEQLPWWLLTLLIAATMLIAAGGYVINDYFDVKIDRINRPDRLIVTRTIDRERTMHLFYGLTAVGVACGLAAAWCTRSLSLAIIYCLMPGVLWFYSASYKRQLLIGNLIIAFSSAVTPLLIAVANVDYSVHEYGVIMRETPLVHNLYVWIGGFALFAFLTTWIREVIKDMQDQMGDREMECHTLPIVWGELASKVFVTVLIILMMATIGYLGGIALPQTYACPTIAESFGAWWHSLSSRYVVFGLMVPLLCELYLLWAARISSDYRNAQQMMKFIMFLGVLYSFVILKLL